MNEYFNKLFFLYNSEIKFTFLSISSSYKFSINCKEIRRGVNELLLFYSSY